MSDQGTMGKVQTVLEGEPDIMEKSSGPKVEEFSDRKAEKIRKLKEKKRGVNIGSKMQRATFRTLSVTERFIGSLTKAYEHIFLGDGDEHVIKDLSKEEGFRYFTKGDYKNALESFEIYVDAAGEKDADILYMMALCHMNTGDGKKAVHYFRKAMELKPKDYDIIFEYTKCLLGMENYQEALIYLKEAIELNPEEGDLYYYCASCYEKLDNIEEAKKAYKKAIDINPREAVYYHALGFVYENIGDHKDAIVCFKKAMDLERQNRGGGTVLRTRQSPKGKSVAEPGVFKRLLFREQD